MAILRDIGEQCRRVERAKILIVVSIAELRYARRQHPATVESRVALEAKQRFHAESC